MDRQDPSKKLKTPLSKYACIRHLPILLAEKEKKESEPGRKETKNSKCFGDVRNEVRMR